MDMASGETLTLSADAPGGGLCDIRAVRKIQPVVMIFDSKQRHPRQKLVKKPRKPSTSAAGKTFAFVNTSRPGKADEESRRLVKTHVMQDVLRRKSSDSSKLEVKPPTTVCLFPESPQFAESPPQAPPSHFLTFPIQTEPYMLKLVHDYVGAMLPTKSKIIDSAWFPLIMTDASLFHALVSTSALFGLHDMVVQRKHMGESIKLINNRLLDDSATSDATITAILFMAKAEYFQQNYSAWAVHMAGVNRILELRGGVEMLPSLIQQKVYSTDLLGCMEIGAVPHFPAVDLPKLLPPPQPYDLPFAILSLAATFNFDSDALHLLSEINRRTISSSPSVHSPSLQYRLLSSYAAKQYQHPLQSFFTTCKTFSSHSRQVQSDIVQELLLIGALLYLSLPHNLELPPVRPVDYGLLLRRLETISTLLFSDQYTLLHHPEFLLWLSFLGEIFSASSISPSTRSREHLPFRRLLKAASVMLDVVTWEEVSLALSTLWGIDGMYEKPYRCLWEDAVTAQGICYEK